MTEQAHEMTIKTKSIYDRIGFCGLFNVVWNSTPYSLRLFVLPYSLKVYGDILKTSSTLEELYENHSYRCSFSKIFRFCRPRYHKARKILKKYEIE